jgi:hypothetical protein
VAKLNKIKMRSMMLMPSRPPDSLCGSVDCDESAKMWDEGMVRGRTMGAFSSGPGVLAGNFQAILSKCEHFFLVRIPVEWQHVSGTIHVRNL